MANTNNRDNTGDILNLETDAESTGENFEGTKRADNLGGGKGDEKTINVGSDNDKEFSQTDQSVSQAAPGQTATNTNQGGSNA
jgi:hypothetical protein